MAGMVASSSALTYQLESQAGCGALGLTFAPEGTMDPTRGLVFRNAAGLMLAAGHVVAQDNATFTSRIQGTLVGLILNAT